MARGWSPRLPPCLRQGLWFCTTHSRLAGPRASKNSVSVSHLRLQMCNTIIWLSANSGDLNPRPQAHIICALSLHPLLPFFPLGTPSSWSPPEGAPQGFTLEINWAPTPVTWSLAGFCHLCHCCSLTLTACKAEWPWYG